MRRFSGIRRPRPSAAAAWKRKIAAGIVGFFDLVARRNQAVPGQLVQCLATPGSARENVVDHSWDSVTAQEAVKLP